MTKPQNVQPSELSLERKVLQELVARAPSYEDLQRLLDGKSAAERAVWSAKTYCYANELERARAVLDGRIKSTADGIEYGLTGPDWEPTAQTRYYAQSYVHAGPSPLPFCCAGSEDEAIEALRVKLSELSKQQVECDDSPSP